MKTKGYDTKDLNKIYKTRVDSGKGDSPRKYDTTKYRENYDLIFKKKK